MKVTVHINTQCIIIHLDIICAKITTISSSDSVISFLNLNTKQ